MRLSFIVAAGLLAAAAVAQASAGGGRPEDPFAALGGLALSAEEAAVLDGGDVNMRFDPNSSRLEIEVIGRGHEVGQERMSPMEYYVVDAHNRVVEEIGCAAYMPSGGAMGRLGNTLGMTSTPIQFPEGTFNIISVLERTDKYGPNMMMTDAYGYVDIFGKDGLYLGKEWDIGYGIHSNTNDFSTSRTWGCIIVRQADNARIAATLRADRENDPHSRQTLTVGYGPDR